MGGRQSADLIPFITNAGYPVLLQLQTLALNDQIGASRHVAALAALLGDVELEMLNWRPV